MRTTGQRSGSAFVAMVKHEPKLTWGRRALFWARSTAITGGTTLKPRWWRDAVYRLPTSGVLSYLSYTAQANCRGMVPSCISQLVRKCLQDTVTGQSDVGSSLVEVFLFPGDSRFASNWQPKPTVAHSLFMCGKLAMPRGWLPLCLTTLVLVHPEAESSLPVF